MNIFDMDIMNVPISKMVNNNAQEDVSLKKTKETRKQQTCSLCQNHEKSTNKKGHKCEYDKKEHFDKCIPCKMTKDRRLSASRDKKNNYQKKKNFGHILSSETSFGKKRNDQMCRKCANHGKKQSMKDHKNACEYHYCPCHECVETERRRNAVKHEAKAKRQRNKHQIKHENDESYPPSPNDSGYNSDRSSSSLPSHVSRFPLPPIESRYCGPISYNHTQTFNSNKFPDFKCKEETKFWESDQSSNYSSSPRDYGFCEPITFMTNSDFKCKEEQQYWDMDLLSTTRTNHYYTNSSSNTFHEIISSPIKNEFCEDFVQNCSNLTTDEKLLQMIVQGLLNNEFDIEHLDVFNV